MARFDRSHIIPGGRDREDERILSIVIVLLLEFSHVF